MDSRSFKRYGPLINWTIVAIVLGYCLLPSVLNSGLFFQHIVFCSEIRGILLNGGRPLPGVEVRRTIHSDGFEGGLFQDRVLTDAQGRYAFMEIAESRWLRPSFFSANPHARITIEARNSAYNYFLWSGGNYKFRTGDEIGQAPIKLSSDLNEAEGEGEYKIIKSKQGGDAQ